MISYPGEILCRFGRYEAVEDLGRSGTAHLWGAWDPYLDRFVIVVELPGIDPVQLLNGMRVVEGALGRWTANKLGGDELVLDFSPGAHDSAAFVVVAMADEDDEPADTQDRQGAPAGGDAVAAKEPAAGIPPPVARSDDTANDVLQETRPPAAGPLILGGIALLTVGLAGGYFMRALLVPGTPVRAAASSGGQPEVVAPPVRTPSPSIAPPPAPTAPRE
jgi:hypothetical protein